MGNFFAYYQTREQVVQLAGRTLRLVVKPGLPDGEWLPAAVHLLAETVSPGERVLVVGVGAGALAAYLALRGPVCLADSNHLALQLTRLTLKANHLPPAEVVGLPLAPQSFDTVAMHLPKGRKLARRWLVEVHAALSDGGTLYLAGANPAGIQSALDDAKSLFGNLTLLRYGKGNRVARLHKDPRWLAAPGWASEPGIARDSWYEWELRARGIPYRLRTLPGVFAYDHLDEGTALLLENLPTMPRERVLDFGCGYGILGMAAAHQGAEGVDLVDVDLLAVASARENLTVNRIPNGRVLPSDVLQAVADQRYTLIVSNPPFHAGRSVEYVMSETFIRHASALLEKGGSLILVANRFVRYERLMQAVFGNAALVAQTGKFHIWKARQQR